MSSDEKHVPPEEEEDQFEDLPENATPEQLAFMQDVRLQEEDASEIRRCLRNWKKEPKARKTLQRIDKISAEIGSVWDGICARDTNLRQMEEYNGSAYQLKQGMGAIEVVKNELITLLAEARDRLISNTNVMSSAWSLRLFYFNTLTAYLDKYEGEEVAGLDSEFILNRVEKYLAAFIVQHCKLTAAPGPADAHATLESEATAIRERVERFVLSIDHRGSIHNSIQKVEALSGTVGTSDKSLPPPTMLKPSPSEPITLESLTRALQSLQAPPPPRQSDLKLPRIEIPQFNGDLSHWLDFKMRFEALVDKNLELSSFKKMHYLKMSLIDTAASTVQNLGFDQYEEAWKLVLRRYQNKKVLIFTAYKALIALKNVSEKSGDLKKLIDDVKDIRFQLTQLEENTAAMNSLFVFVVSQRLPPETFEAWELSCKDKTLIPQFDDLDDFIEGRIHTLVSMERRTGSTFRSHASTSRSSQVKCKICAQPHMNYKCPNLSRISPSERLQLVRDHQLCELCINDHLTSACPHIWSCKVCKGKHHSMLHVDPLGCNVCHSSKHVLLPTAIVTLIGSTGQTRLARMLIDQGSMTSFVSESLVQALRLPRQNSLSSVAGIGETHIPHNGVTTISFTSRFDQKRLFTVDSLIVPKVVTVLPEVYSALPADLSRLPLADKQFWKGGGVDGILGADIYDELIMPGLIKSQLLAQQSHLGWLLSGKVSSSAPIIGCYSVVQNKLDIQLQKFWETEEKLIIHPSWTPEQQAAEKFYSNTTTRSESGRFVCRLPLKDDFALGESRRAAVGNLVHLEKRFRSNPALKERYVASMNDYFTTGHAVPAPTVPVPERHCYLPHLAVIKDSSLTTQTRVVYNASSKTTNKKSLNDNLLVGPVVQLELWVKIMRFMVYLYVFVCDIVKMYRHIDMNKLDWDLQRFVWRENEDDPIKDYWLTTVTFGQASAPFTATRTLVQLAKDVVSTHPIASKILLEETYVDDIQYGAPTKTHLIEGCHQVIEALQSASFSLRKWNSNLAELMESLPVELINPNEEISFLGLIWNWKKDQFKYPTPNFPERSSVVKREMLSDISLNYDPPGWAQPLIIQAKVLMQSLWKRKLMWNDRVPDDLVAQWKIIAESLSQISTLSIPRWSGYLVGEEVELHGFCDASGKAYGACVYIKTPSGVKLLCAKSRVAPIQVITIPKLELKGALLLAELITKLKAALAIDAQIFCWCDSTVALSWIVADPLELRPFVRNRAASIQELTDKNNWLYVRSADNPADLVSRGTTIQVLRESSLWWYGPSWLLTWQNTQRESFSVSQLEKDLIAAETLKPCVVGATVVAEDCLVTALLNQWSSYFKVCRVLAWMSRFATNMRYGKVLVSDWLTIEELEKAERLVIKALQLMQFGEDIRRIQAGKSVRNNSRVKTLSPFLDEHGIFRVGGRLSNSELPFEAQHPVLLSDHPIVRSIIQCHHKNTLHGGVTLTLTDLRKKFWLINGLELVKKFCRKCLVCHRHRPRLLEQLMAALPANRVTFEKAFLHSGLDFAGPFTLKAEVGRGHRSYKVYIAIFVCLATKAIHLEVVGSLTTESLLSAIRRFIGRRSHVTHLYSDNGTNNVGAFRQLEGMQKAVESCSLKWTFIPPAAPHFGGLWEAGVKSMKTHLKKVLTPTLCTFEEMSTITAQIEAVLNSRPLCALTNDPDDLRVLTPMHFLTGTQYVPVVDDTEELTRLRTRYEYVQAQYHTVCKRYKTEYLTRLQSRPKWLKQQPNIRVGQLVLIKEDTIATTQWPLGRVTEVHPGPDGVVRVVTLKTKNGTKKRPVVKLSPLPVDTATPTLTAAHVSTLRTQ